MTDLKLPLRIEYGVIAGEDDVVDAAGVVLDLEQVVAAVNEAGRYRAALEEIEAFSSSPVLLGIVRAALKPTDTP